MKHKVEVESTKGPAVKRHKKGNAFCEPQENGKAEEVFTSLEFKNLLKEPESQILGLNKFSKACENFDPRKEDTVDIVKSYISTSPDCVEIFKCFGAQNSTGIFGPIFRSLICILTRCTGDLKELYDKVGISICSSIIQSHLQKIYRALASRQSPRTITYALRLLTIMVMQGKDTAREVSNRVDFSMRCFKEVLSFSKGKLGYEVRLCYIKFVLSFFVTDDSQTIRKILESQGLVSSIFQGLVSDPASIVQLVLTTLKEKAIKNVLVPKTAKAHFFAEPKLLSRIASLFEWDGVSDVVVEGANDSVREHIRQLVYEFLYHACCPFKYGINFRDRMLGIEGKSRNHVLLDFLFHLVPLTTDLLVHDLVTEILKACPDLLPRYMNDFRLTLDPKDTEIWSRNFEIIKAAYEAQPAVAVALTQAASTKLGSSEEDKISCECLVKMTIPGIFSPNFTAQSALRHCLKSKLLEVCKKSLSLTVLFLEKVEATLKFAHDVTNWEKSLYSGDEIESLVLELEDELLKTYVSAPLIISFWKDVSNEKSNHLNDLVLQVLWLLQKTFPQSLADAKFDFTRLLDGIKTLPENYLGSEVNISVLTLKMLSNVAHQCKWFRSGDDKETPFRKLLQIIYDSKNINNQLHGEAVLLFQKILFVNGVLSADKSSEARVWAEYTVPKLKTHNDFAVMRFLSDVCGLVVRTPIKYIEILSSQEQVVATSDDTAKVTVDFWDSLPDVEIQAADWKSIPKGEKCIEYGNIEGAELRDNIGDSTYPMSLFSVAALDSLQQFSSLGSEEQVILDQYLSQVLDSLFHLLPTVEAAKFFTCTFEAIVKNISNLEMNYPSVENFAKFLSLWSEHGRKGFRPQSDQRKRILQGWMWDLYRKKKGKDQNLKKFLSELTTDKPQLGYNVEVLIPQSLLYFDTLLRFRNDSRTVMAKPAKELQCVIVSILQKILRDRQGCKLQAENSVRDVGPSDLQGAYRDPSVFSDSRSVSLWKRVIQNPSMQKMFFENIYQLEVSPACLEAGISQLLDTDRSLSDICTSLIVDVLAILYIKSNCTLDCYAETLMSKILASIPKLLGELAGCKKHSGDLKYFLLMALKKVEPLIDSKELRCLFEESSRLLSGVSSIEVGILFTGFLCDCGQSLLSRDSTGVSHAAFQMVFEFLQSGHLVDYARITTIIIAFLDRFPTLSVIAPKSLLDWCLQRRDPPAVSLAVKLLQCNPSFVLHSCFFQKKLVDFDLDEKIKIIPMISEVIKIFMVCVPSTDKNPADQLKGILDSYKGFLQSGNFENIVAVLKVQGGNEFLEQWLTASVRSGDLTALSHLAKLIESSEQQHGSRVMEIVALNDILLQFSDFSENVPAFKVTAFLTLYNLIAFTKGEKLPMLHDKLLSVTNRLKESDCNEIRKKSSTAWAEFVKNTLKTYFESKTALKCLTKLIKVICDETQPFIIDQNQSDVSTIRAMVISHSKFLPTILNKDVISEDDGTTLKDALTELLLQLTLRCNSAELSDKDLGYLLGAYTCNLSFSDQNILRIILVYEQKGVDLGIFKPFLWGEAALSSYRTRKNLGDTLWKRPGPSEILSYIDKDVMETTLSRFPVRRRMVLIDQDVKDGNHFINDCFSTISAIRNEIQKHPRSSQKVYDPCFLLPTLFELLNPQNLVDCKLFVRSGAFSFLLSCLASHCSIVRSLSASCLGLYYQHAQTAWFSENNLTMYVIRCIRNSLEPKSGQEVLPRLSSVVANFFANLVALHLAPEDHMFAVLHRFLLVKPQFDLKNIPEFYVLFFSAEMESKVERTWILNLVSQSLRDMGDYHVIKKKNVFQLLMCLHDSPICDNYCRRQIFEIFEEACSIRGAANDLVKSSGLITWLTEAAFQQPGNHVDTDIQCQFGAIGKRQGNTEHIVRVVSTVWRTLNTEDFVADEIVEKESYVNRNNVKQEKHAVLAPFRVVKQLINLTLVLLDNLTRFSKDFGEMKNGDHDVMEILLTLESCLANLEERRKLASRRRDLQDTLDSDLSDLQVHHIVTLLNTTSILGKFDGRNAEPTIVKIFTFWDPTAGTDSNHKTNDSELWKKCLCWSLGSALPSWSKNPAWLKKNLIRFLSWSQKWVLSLENGLDISTCRLLAKCYDVICHNSASLGEKFSEGISIMNILLHHGSYLGKNSEFEWLSKMQNIRLRLLPND